MPIVTAPLPDLVLYARAGCSLCDEARAALTLLLGQRAATGRPVPKLAERDIATDPELERALFDRIPVVEIAGHRLELATSPAKLRRLIEEALDSEPAAAR
jgi:hypothetical protein